MNFAFAYGGPVIKDTIYLHSKKAKAKQSYLKNGLPFSLPPVKPGVTSYVKFTVNHQDDKLLSDVEVYPNPATDLINLKYDLSRNSNVSIKIMDVLGMGAAGTIPGLIAGLVSMFTHLTTSANGNTMFYLVVAGSIIGMIIGFFFGSPGNPARNKYAL